MTNFGFLGVDVVLIGVAGLAALVLLRAGASRTLLGLSWYALLSGAALVFLALVAWATASRSDDLVVVAFLGALIMSLAGVLALASQAVLDRVSIVVVWVAGVLWLLLTIEAAILSGEPEEGAVTVILVVIPFWTLVVAGPLFAIAITATAIALGAKCLRSESAFGAVLGIGLLTAVAYGLLAWGRGSSTWSSAHLGVEMCLVWVVGGVLVFLVSRYLHLDSTVRPGAPVGTRQAP